MVSRNHLNVVVAVLLFALVQYSTAYWPVDRVYRRQETPARVQPEESPLITERPQDTRSGGSSGAGDELTFISSVPETVRPESSLTTTASLPFTSSTLTSVAAGGQPTPPPNNQLTSNVLPITPKITPGFAIAGILMILSGIVYTIFGLRTKLLHIFLSTTYLASLATSVLILYIINLPVSNAIQTAYVAAVFASGAILGGISTLFTEVTEGLACLFGGFCMSMWLLVLRPGGILSGTGKTLLIAIFSIVGFASSCSDYTKTYALMVLIPFGGATSIIIGIDCFSRAGLKEFWAYIWNLNSDLFPKDVSSYPLNRGMKVEIACIIVIFIAGLVSQLQIWKVVKQQKLEKEDEILEDERRMKEEEENIGRKIETENAKEKQQWEAVYGSREKDAVKKFEERRDSGIADVASSRERPFSIMMTPTYLKAEFEVSHEKSPTTGLVGKSTDGSSIIVRVAQDTDENGIPVRSFSRTGFNYPLDRSDSRSSANMLDAENSTGLERRSSHGSNFSREIGNVTNTNGPILIPLPFTIPEEVEPSADNRSSVGTVATLGDEEKVEAFIGRNTSTSGKSMSVRRLSILSQKSTRSKTFSGDSYKVDDDDKRSSLAATIDDFSDDEEEKSARFSQEVMPDLPEKVHPTDEKETLAPETSPENSAGESPKEGDSAEQKEMQEKINDEHNELIGWRSSSPGAESRAADDIQQKNIQGSNEHDEISESAIQSQPQSISEDALPRQFSKVFMSYRTNEWAKHLSYAETPEIEDLVIAEDSNDAEIEVKETPAPVNVNELQQTPLDATLPPFPIARSLSTQHTSPTSTKSSPSNNVTSSRLSRFEQKNAFDHQGNVITPNNVWQSPNGSTRGGSTNVQSQGNRAPPPAYLNSMQGKRDTLMSKRDSIIKQKNIYKTPLGGSSMDLGMTTGSQASSSDAGSLLVDNEDDEDMPLSQRRNLIRMSSQVPMIYRPKASSSAPILGTFDSHQPQRHSLVPSSNARHHQMASWRASIQQDFKVTHAPRERIDQQRNRMQMNRIEEERRQLADEHLRNAREGALEEKMRSQEMLNAHRDAMRRMQEKANKKVEVS